MGLLLQNFFTCKSASRNSRLTKLFPNYMLLVYSEDVLKEKVSIFDGVGTPDLQLALYLLLTWTIIALILIKGVKSSGKAAYFLGMQDFVHCSRSTRTACHWIFFSSFSIPHHDNIVLPLGYASRCRKWYSVSIQTRMAFTLFSRGLVCRYNSGMHKFSMDMNLYFNCLNCSGVLLIEYLLWCHYDVCLLQQFLA